MEQSLRPRPQSSDQSQFGAFRASLLYCPSCQTATPTRERLLLVLSTGNLYEYFCAQCGTSTGEKTDQETQDPQIILP
ncbi:MAG: cytoplasmic protein [Nitrospirales bacterium]|nr:cytoplasmic protein [Nitrospirales bacterium]